MQYFKAAQILNTIIMFGQSNTLWNRLLSSTEAENCYKANLLSQPLSGLGVWAHNLGSPKQTHPSLTVNLKQSSNDTSQFPEAVAAKVPVLVCSAHCRGVFTVRAEGSIPGAVLVVSSKDLPYTWLRVMFLVTYPSGLLLQPFQRFGRLLITMVDFCCL